MEDADAAAASLPEVAWQDERQLSDGAGTALHEQPTGELYSYSLLHVLLFVVLTHYVLRW